MKQIKRREELEKAIDSVPYRSCFGFDPLPITELWSFSCGDILIRSGTASAYLYFLVRGELCFCTTSETGRTIYLGAVRSFSVLGEVSSLWKKNPANDVRAVSDGLVLAISLPEHRSQLLNDVVFLQYLCSLLSYRLVLQNDKALSASVSSSKRTAAFLLENCRDGRLTITLKECAAELCISTRQLIRIMNDFVEKGALRREKRHYFIEDDELLYSLSSSTYTYYE